MNDFRFVYAYMNRFHCTIDLFEFELSIDVGTHKNCRIRRWTSFQSILNRYTITILFHSKWSDRNSEAVNKWDTQSKHDQPTQSLHCIVIFYITRFCMNFIACSSINWFMSAIFLHYINHDVGRVAVRTLKPTLISNMVNTIYAIFVQFITSILLSFDSNGKYYCTYAPKEAAIPPH